MKPFPYQAVIFDVDGTLYRISTVQRRVLFRLALDTLFHPWRIRDLLIVYQFRKIRDRLARAPQKGLDAAQVNATAHACRVPPERVRRVIQRWILDEPLPYLAAARLPEVEIFIQHLLDAKIPVGIFSDYPFREKLSALGLPDLPGVHAAEAEVDTLKPDPAGLRVLCARLGVDPGYTLFIGDRDELDGEAARRLNMPYHIRTRQGTPRPGEFRTYRELINRYFSTP